MTGEEFLYCLKKELAEKNYCEMGKVNCYHCKHFGYNRGLVLNSVFSSKCDIIKRKTGAMQVCKKFEFYK